MDQPVPEAAALRVKHIVMWNLQASDDGGKDESVKVVKARFEALKGVIPGLLHIEVGVDRSRVSYACDVVLYSEFESAKALAAYAAHPAHRKIRDELEGVRIARHQVDYEATGEAGR